MLIEESLLTFALLSYDSHAAIGRGRFFLIAFLLVLLVFLLAHLCHLLSVEPTAPRERCHTEVVKINENDCINMFWFLRSSLSAMTFFSAMNQQMVYPMFHGGLMNKNDAYVKVEGIIRDNEGITKMGIIREAWKVGIGERMARESRETWK